MTQNINLIEDLEIQQISVFNSKLIMQISLSWILLLILTYFLAIGINSNKQKTLHNLETTHKKLVDEIATYNQIATPFKNKFSPDLPVSALNLLGFSPYLEDLAKYTPDGVWLTEVVFSEIDNNITIKGSAISAPGVTALLQAIDKADRFNDKKFSTLQLEKNFKSNSTDFTISSISNTTNPTETKK